MATVFVSVVSGDCFTDYTLVITTILVNLKRVFSPLHIFDKGLLNYTNEQSYLFFRRLLWPFDGVGLDFFRKLSFKLKDPQLGRFRFDDFPTPMLEQQDSYPMLSCGKRTR